METAYIGLANTIRRKLVADGAELSSEQKQAITRVVADVDGVCLDTDKADDPIEYADGVVTMQIGLAQGVETGIKTVLMRAYDAEKVEAFGEFRVNIKWWGECPG